MSSGDNLSSLVFRVRHSCKSIDLRNVALDALSVYREQYPRSQIQYAELADGSDAVRFRSIGSEISVVVAFSPGVAIVAFKLPKAFLLFRRIVEARAEREISAMARKAGGDLLDITDCTENQS
jgi:hypothetical protein